MGAKERRVREKEELRRRILDAAREIVLKEGCDCVTMRRVAEKIEYTPTTIYLYFKDKEELIGTVCEETFLGLLKVLERVEQDYKEPLKRLQAGCQAYVDFGLANPELYRVGFLTPVEQPLNLKEIAQKFPAGFKAFDFLRRSVETCIKQGVFRNGDTETASQAVWACLHGITSLLIIKPFFPWVAKDRLIDFVIGDIIDGLKR